MLNKTLTCSLFAPPSAFLVKCVARLPSQNSYTSPSPRVGSCRGTCANDFSDNSVESIECDKTFERDCGPRTPDRWAPTSETISWLSSRSLQRERDGLELERGMSPTSERGGETGTH